MIEKDDEEEDVFIHEDDPCLYPTYDMILMSISLSFNCYILCMWKRITCVFTIGI